MIFVKENLEDLLRVIYNIFDIKIDRKKIVMLF